MKVLVCGGRDYNDKECVFRNLDMIANIYLISEIIEGGARGADALGKLWAIERKIPFITFHADWNQYGKSAGFRRNKEMLEQGKPWLVVAFPGGRGTANMIELARKANVQLRVIQ